MRAVPLDNQAMLDNNAMAAAIRTAIDDSPLTQKGIADAFNVTEQAVSGWLRTGKVDKRKIPKLAQLTGKPLSHFGMGGFGEPVSSPATSADYVRVQQLDAEAGMGGERVNDDYPEVIKAMDFAPAYIRSVIGFVPPAGRLKLVTGVGDSMAPKIRPGEAVLVDTGCNEFVGDGLYLINTGRGQQIKALQAQPDGIWARSSDQILYPPFLLSDESIIGGRVYLIHHLERVA